VGSEFIMDWVLCHRPRLVRVSGKAADGVGLNSQCYRADDKNLTASHITRIPLFLFGGL
jgi:hypothetical protein